jgi:predicted lactoylglutathione lyase
MSGAFMLDHVFLPVSDVARRQGRIEGATMHVGFLASSRSQVQAADEAAIEAGARGNGARGVREYFEPRYSAANIFDLDGHRIEFVYKGWQHPAR